MPPTLLILGIGRRRKIPLPLPLFLLWPFAFLAWLLLIVARLAFSEERGEDKLWRARTALYSFANLSGLRIDVRSSDGGGVYLWMI